MTNRSDSLKLPAAPEVIQTEVGMLQNFCELLYCPETGEAAVVDPAFEVDRLLRLAKEHKLTISSVLVTHTHHDHIEGVADMVTATGARVFVHPNEAHKVQPLCQEITLVADLMDIAIGKRGVRVLETFGHTNGGVCYLADGYLVAGDVLFVGGCGRSDFPGGSTAALWQSLNRLMALPEETIVYPGHNYGSTLTSSMGREILENPYLRCQDFEAFRVLRERVRKA
jgi:glyoxylase-like metal-dependent hydrolase (beta-lactamase superfamily II)